MSRIPPIQIPPLTPPRPARAWSVPVVVTTLLGTIGLALPAAGSDLAGPVGVIAGRVTDAATGDPIPGVSVGLFDEAGSLIASGVTNTAGNYLSPGGLLPGTYFARTLNGRDLGYSDERFDELPCTGSCPITEATPILVVAGEVTGGVDFTLGPRPFFFDGFESGGLGFWGAVTGGIGCAHSMCITGGLLDPGCDPCVAAICAVDSFCCVTAWDGLCVNEVTSVCELDCP
jgi:hypothetical protein